MFFALSFHEAAHAITALWLGDDLARSMGRVTLNPMSHVDPFGTVLLPILLAWSGMPIFGYARPVPVRVESLRNHRRAHILISLAGVPAIVRLCCRFTIRTTANMLTCTRAPEILRSLVLAYGIRKYWRPFSSAEYPE